MTAMEVLQCVRELACSKGSYVRMLNSLLEMSKDERDEVLEYIGNQCRDRLEFVLMMEG